MLEVLFIVEVRALLQGPDHLGSMIESVLSFEWLAGRPRSGLCTFRVWRGCDARQDYAKILVDDMHDM